MLDASGTVCDPIGRVRLGIRLPMYCIELRGGGGGFIGLLRIWYAGSCFDAPSIPEHRPWWRGFSLIVIISTTRLIFCN